MRVGGRVRRTKQAVVIGDDNLFQVGCRALLSLIESE